MGSCKYLQTLPLSLDLQVVVLVIRGSNMIYGKLKEAVCCNGSKRGEGLNTVNEELAGDFQPHKESYTNQSLTEYMCMYLQSIFLKTIAETIRGLLWII